MDDFALLNLNSGPILHSSVKSEKKYNFGKDQMLKSTFLEKKFNWSGKRLQRGLQSEEIITKSVDFSDRATTSQLAITRKNL
jgi:hypothetical protein